MIYCLLAPRCIDICAIRPSYLLFSSLATLLFHLSRFVRMTVRGAYAQISKCLGGGSEAIVGDTASPCLVMLVPVLAVRLIEARH